MHNSDRLAISLMFGVYVAQNDGGSFFYQLFTMLFYSVAAYMVWLWLDGIRS